MGELISNTHYDWELKLLDQLVRISSRSGDTRGITSVFELLISTAQRLLPGVEIHIIPSDTPGGGAPLFHLVHNPAGQTKLTLICHADCVRANPHAQGIEMRGLHAFGIGVADNKGGVVAALSFISQLITFDRDKQFRVDMICSPSEETGSIGWHQKMAEIGEGSDFHFGFEPALDSGALISRRSGNRWYLCKISGQASHAGRVGHAHLNAAHEAAHKIVALHALNDPSRGIKLNIGDIHGGQGLFNLTCGECTFKLDVRFRSLADRDFLHEKIKAILERKDLGDQLEIHWQLEDDCPPLQTDPCDEFHFFIAEAISAWESEAGTFADSGGAADINYLPKAKIAALDGLGPIGYRLHELQESIEVNTLSTRPRALAQALWNFYHQNRTYSAADLALSSEDLSFIRS